MLLAMQASSSSANTIIAEVDINNQLPACRNNLTRSSTQDEVTSLLCYSCIGFSIRDDVKGRTLIDDEAQSVSMRVGVVKGIEAWKDCTLPSPPVDV